MTASRQPHRQDPLEGLLLGAVPEPQHHPDGALCQDIADALEQQREIAIAEQRSGDRRGARLRRRRIDRRRASGRRRSVGSSSASRMARTRRSVSSETGPPLMTRETVARETPLRAAMIVERPSQSRPPEDLPTGGRSDASASLRSAPHHIARDDALSRGAKRVRMCRIAQHSATAMKALSTRELHSQWKRTSVTTRRFPTDFTWGAATAVVSDRRAVSRATDAARASGTGSRDTPGRVRYGDTGDVACDHYHRYRDDAAVMAELGSTAYRFSDRLAAGRSRPGPGPVNAGRASTSTIASSTRCSSEVSSRSRLCTTGTCRRRSRTRAAGRRGRPRRRSRSTPRHRRRAARRQGAAASRR